MMSKTIKNLITAYLGECQARNRYTFYASAAKKEGFEQIAEIMTTTAEQEKKHGKTFYEFLVKLNKDSETPTNIDLNLDLEIEVVLGSTADNLKSCIRLENDEFANLYPKFADEAEAEGHLEIAAKFRAIAHAEEHHKMNFEKLLTLVES
jgi:rubrerythrin